MIRCVKYYGANTPAAPHCPRANSHSMIAGNEILYSRSVMQTLVAQLSAVGILRSSKVNGNSHRGIASIAAPDPRAGQRGECGPRQFPRQTQLPRWHLPLQILGLLLSVKGFLSTDPSSICGQGPRATWCRMRDVVHMGHVMQGEQRGAHGRDGQNAPAEQVLLRRAAGGGRGERPLHAGDAGQGAHHRAHGLEVRLGRPAGMLPAKLRLKATAPASSHLIPPCRASFHHAIFSTMLSRLDCRAGLNCGNCPWTGHCVATGLVSAVPVA